MKTSADIRQYVQSLTEWVEETRQSYLALEQGLSYRSETSPVSQLKIELEQIGQQIDTIRELPQDSLEIHEEVAKVKESSERIYQQILSMINKTKKSNQQGNSPPHSHLTEGQSSNRPVPIGGHKLPPLPYSYDALEPYIDRETMRLHHTKHHQSYVDGLNKAERKMAEARRTGDFEMIRHWEREAAFHGAGHYLHTIFWNNMSPRGGGSPTGEIAEQINQDFGSFQAFKKHFTEAANEAEGVGWAILVWAPRSHRLEILQAEKHQLLSQWDVIPLLVLDVWEHAYYLHYKNERIKYIENWWNIVNWDHVNQRFNQAKKLKWQPF